MPITGRFGRAALRTSNGICRPGIGRYSNDQVCRKYRQTSISFQPRSTSAWLILRTKRHRHRLAADHHPLGVRRNHQRSCRCHHGHDEEDPDSQLLATRRSEVHFDGGRGHLHSLCAQAGRGSDGHPRQHIHRPDKRRRCRHRVFCRRQGVLEQVRFQILMRLPDFQIGMFEHLSEQRVSMNDQSLAKQTLRDGQGAHRQKRMGGADAGK